MDSADITNVETTVKSVRLLATEHRVAIRVSQDSIGSVLTV